MRDGHGCWLHYWMGEQLNKQQQHVVQTSFQRHYIHYYYLAIDHQLHICFALLLFARDQEFKRDTPTSTYCTLYPAYSWLPTNAIYTHNIHTHTIYINYSLWTVRSTNTYVRTCSRIRGASSYHICYYVRTPLHRICICSFILFYDEI